MSRYICKDCGTGYATMPPFNCLTCSSGNIATEADNAPEGPSGAPEAEYIDKMLRHLLDDLCEKVYNGPNTEEFRNTEIERTIERIRPHLVAQRISSSG